MDLFKASFLSYISLDFKKFGIDMVSFPDLKKDLCDALKKTMGMECRVRHIPAVAQWLLSPHSHTAPINKIYHKYYYLTSWYNMYILTYLHFSWIKCVYSMQLRKK